MTGILNRRSRFLFAAPLALAVAGGVPRPVGAQLMMSEAEEVATGKREDDSPDVNAFALPGGYIYVTFTALARRSPLGRHAEGYLRVINGLYPAGEPAAGQALKIVE